MSLNDSWLKQNKKIIDKCVEFQQTQITVELFSGDEILDLKKQKFTGIYFLVPDNRWTYMINGVTHNEEIPAYWDSTGSYIWYNDGLRHNLNGPAVYDAHYRKFSWFIKEIKYTEEQFYNHPSVIGRKLKSVLDI